MPSRVLTARLILVVVVSLVFGGESQILGSDDDLFTYYAPADSQDSHPSAQAQKQLFSGSADASLNVKPSGSDSGDEVSQQNADSSLQNSESVSKIRNQLSSLVENSLTLPYRKGSGAMSEEEEKAYSDDVKSGMEMLPRMSSAYGDLMVDKRTDSGERMKLLQQTARNRYLRLPGLNTWANQQLKRERNAGRSGATLSVESSLDLIRTRFLQELNRKKQLQKQKQIENNDEILRGIGKKRNGGSRAIGRGTSQMH